MAIGTLGFIGGGNMARAILGGILKAGLAAPEQVVVSDVNAEQLARLSAEFGVATTTDNSEVVRRSQTVMLCTKPFHVKDVLTAAAGDWTAEKVLVSICAGIPTGLMEGCLGGDARVVRTMPNICALVGAGAAGVSGGRFATADDVALVVQILGAVGQAVEVPEEQLDLVTGLTGSGPAYVFEFAEALIESAVELGMSAEQAGVLVRQLLVGAAHMAQTSTQSLAELRAAVTTKGGTTEAGLKALAEGDFRSLMGECVAAATARSRELRQG